MSDKNQYNLTPDDIDLLREVSKEILSSLEFDHVLNNSISRVVNKLDLIGGSLTLVEGNKLHAKTIAGNRAQIFLRLIGGPITKLKIDLNPESKNLIVQSVLQNKVFVTNNFTDFTAGIVNKALALTAKKLISIKSCIVLPLEVHGQTIGALFAAKEVKDDFAKEIPILELLSDHIAIAIYNANLYKLSEQRASALEESLVEINELRRKERDLIAVLAHEIKTPLTTIVGAIQLLNNEIKSAPEKFSSLTQLSKMALKAAERQKELTQRLFSVAASDSQEDKVEIDEVKFVQLVANSIEIHKPIFSDKQINLVSKLPANELVVQGDRMKLIEIVDNLISNAIKYTGKGKIEIEIKEKNQYVKFMIKDTGVGIHKEELANLGKKFFRAKKGRTDFHDPGGTGLGLYIVNNYLKLMDSQLKISSKLGKGTKFEFLLKKASNADK